MRPTTWAQRLQALTGMFFVVLFCAVAAVPSPAQAPDTLVNFDGTIGGNPASMSMIQGTDGNLWGTTLRGGATYDPGINQGYGEVFKMTPSGAFTIVYNFCSQANCTDGSFSYAPLVQGTDGNFYGTTAGGGAYNGGSVFKLTPQGELTTLYSFCEVQGCPDGTNIYGGLIQASNGDFYGVAEEGGTGGGCGCGTVFKITKKGKLTTIHNFKGADGASPVAALIQVSSGAFYGMTSTGGANNSGTVFKMTAGGKITTLYSFCAQSGCADGGAPQDSLVQGSDGNFYGVTYNGDGNSEPCIAGCVFQITPTGTLTNLYQFNTQAAGLQPLGGLTQDTNGNLYGSTYLGGSWGEGADSGTIFEAPVGLGPFVTTTPTFGRVGAKVTILGTDLTSASSVTFNGTAATFTVVSATEITTTVPTGATNGTVEVVTSGGTLTSNPSFTVTK